MTIPQITDQNSQPVRHCLKVGETCHYRCPDSGDYLLVEKMADVEYEVAGGGEFVYRQVFGVVGQTNVVVLGSYSSALRIYAEQA